MTTRDYKKEAMLPRGVAYAPCPWEILNDPTCNGLHIKIWCYLQRRQAYGATKWPGLADILRCLNYDADDPVQAKIPDAARKALNDMANRGWLDVTDGPNGPEYVVLNNTHWKVGT